MRDSDHEEPKSNVFRTAVSSVRRQSISGRLFHLDSYRVQMADFDALKRGHVDIFFV